MKPTSNKRTTLLLIVFSIMLSSQIYSQAGDKRYTHFVSVFNAELKKYNIGDIKKHYDKGYFRTTSESEYLDKDVEVGLTTLFERCGNKDDSSIKEEIKIYFEQLKQLKNERKSLNEEILNFDSTKEKLKIRMYPDLLKNTYSKNDAIIKTKNPGIIEVVVIDLPTGIGSLEAKYLKHWGISIDSVYTISKENTLKQIRARFVEMQPTQNGIIFNLFADDDDLFVTSCILDLGRFNIPKGKYGSFVSIPNSAMVIVIALDDKEAIENSAADLIGAADSMYGIEEMKPISNNLFWYNGKELKVIEKNYKQRKLIYPTELKDLIR
ncbi:hypothetical protein [Dysgonomonas alginatilytica]|nr:hypothetical protein [Dysgonomonas alginatilytica]